MRISGEGIARQLLAQRPGVRAAVFAVSFTGDGQFEIGEITGVVSAARPDHQRQQIAGAHRQGGRRDGADLLVVRDTAGHALTLRTSPAFQRPGHAVAAGVVRVGDHAGDAHGAGDRTAPADRDGELGRGMDDDTVRFDQAGNAHVTVG